MPSKLPLSQQMARFIYNVCLSLLRGVLPLPLKGCWTIPVITYPLLALTLKSVGKTLKCDSSMFQLKAVERYLDVVLFILP